MTGWHHAGRGAELAWGERREGGEGSEGQGGEGVFLRSGASRDVRCVKICVLAPDLALYSPVRRFGVCPCGRLATHYVDELRCVGRGDTGAF